MKYLNFFVLYIIILLVSCTPITAVNVNPINIDSISFDTIKVDPEGCINSNPYVQKRCCGKVRMITQQDCKNKYAAFYEHTLNAMMRPIHGLKIVRTKNNLIKFSS